MARLLDHYNTTVATELATKFGVTNKMAIPKLEKIVINMGVGRATQDKALIEAAVDSLTKIAFAITGTRWNGPRFFGLRDKQTPPTSEAGR